MDVRVVTGVIMVGFAVGTAVEVSWLIRHRNDLRTLPPSESAARDELRAHRESRILYGAVRALGGTAMTLLLAWLTFVVEPGNPEWSGF